MDFLAKTQDGRTLPPASWHKAALDVDAGPDLANAFTSFRKTIGLR